MTPDTHAEADALLDRALDSMASADPAAAIPYLQKAMALAPDHPAAAHALMRAFEESGHLPEALALAQDTVTAEPDDVPWRIRGFPSSCSGWGGFQRRRLLLRARGFLAGNTSFATPPNRLYDAHGNKATWRCIKRNSLVIKFI